MLRTARRLRLEACEDRSLPSALAPLTRPPTDTAHTSTAAESADEATEYAHPGQPVTRTSNPPTAVARALVPDYVVAAYPAVPPTPGEPAAPPPAVSPPAPSAASTSAPVIAAVAPAPTPAVQPPPPAPVIPESAAAVPPDDQPDDGPVESPGSPAGSGDQPAVADLEFPPVGPVSAGVLGIGELDLCVNLAGWTTTAGRLLDGLDGVADALDGESPWVRLGYWALAIGTVGVTVELTRQGLRTKPPDPMHGPSLPVPR